MTDISLVVLKDQPLFRTVIPSKIVESMAMMKPVILAVRGESEALVEESQAGLCVQPGSAVQLARAIRRLHGDPDERWAMGVAGRAYVQQRFDRQVLAARYAEFLGTLVVPRTAPAETPVQE